MALPYVTEAQVIKLIEAAAGSSSGGNFTVYDLPADEEPAQEDLAAIYANKPMCVRFIGEDNVVFLYLQEDAAGDNRLYYAAAQIRENELFAVKIEYSAEDNLYIAEPYTFELTPKED